MEKNQSHSSYPDSGDSSPRSREVDDTPSWAPPSSNYKVKFMCSYGGKIQPRPHDNHLAYIGGDTKIISLDRTINYSSFTAKLSSLSSSFSSPCLCFKYQLPDEDLDALISVTNDEDLEHMMLEYDRLFRASSPKPARLRIFLFNLSPTSFGSGDTAKSEGQWFVDALNSVPAPQPDSGNSDCLFGLEKGFPTDVPMTTTQLASDTAAAVAAPAQPQQQPPSIPEVVGSDKDFPTRLELEGRPGDSVMNHQIQDFQRFQISNDEQVVVSNARGEFYVPENVAPGVRSPVSVQAPMPISGNYVQERHVTNGSDQQKQQVYLIPMGNGMYQSQAMMRPVTGQMGPGPGYYGVERVVQEVYREQQHPAYNVIQQQQQQQGNKVGVYSREGMGVAEQQQQGYIQVGYDSSGRLVYFTPGPMSAMDARIATTGAVNQDVKVVAAAATTVTDTTKIAQAQAS
ncbi:hypothetical protein LINPERPRIM_LOCUS39072 [Linum perenne]